MQSPAPLPPFHQSHCAMSREVLWVLFSLLAGIPTWQWPRLSAIPAPGPWEHRQDSFARTKNCSQGLWSIYVAYSWGKVRQGEMWPWLLSFHMDIQIEKISFPMQMWLTWPSLRQGWRTEHFTFSPLFITLFLRDKCLIYWDWLWPYTSELGLHCFSIYTGRRKNRITFYLWQHYEDEKKKDCELL